MLNGRERFSRRELLSTGLVGTTVGFTGCLRMGEGEGQTTTRTGLAEYDDVMFAFEYSDGSLTIRHTGGGSIPAGNLVIRSSEGTQVRWHELGSTAVPASGTVTARDEATIGASVLNWPTAVEQSETIRVVFVSEDGSPTTLATFEPTGTETPAETTQDAETETTEDTETSGGRESRIIGDDFEADHDMSPYQIDTVEADSYDWGTAESDAPDGGSRHGWIRENDSGKGTRVVAVSDTTISWDRSYSFDFLVRCSEYSTDGPWNKNDIAWRGHREGLTEHMISLRIFDTDDSGNDDPFKWVGGGIVDSDDGHSIDWQPSVWYKITGYVSEETGDAEAKMWKVTEPEPSEYQISATVETGVTEELPYSVRVSGRSGYPITMDLAHLSWNSR